MVEVKLLQQGFQWTDLIAPAVTIGGVYFAYRLHRKGVRKDLQREKAEQILSEVVELENRLRLQTTEDIYEKNIFDEVLVLWSSILSLCQIYLPKYLPDELTDKDPFTQLQRFLVNYQIFVHHRTGGHKKKMERTDATIEEERKAAKEADRNLRSILSGIRHFKISLTKEIQALGKIKHRKQHSVWKTLLTKK